MNEIRDYVPPQSLEMEQAAIGSMLVDSQTIDEVMWHTKPGDFYRDAHRWIFEAVTSLWREDEPVDVLTVEAKLKERDLLESCGGRAYLVNLINLTVTPSNAAHYAKEVRDKALLRRLLEASTRIIDAVHSGAEKIEEVVARCESALTDATNGMGADTLKYMRPLISDAFEQMEEWSRDRKHITGIPTGIDDLDFLTRGLQPDSLYIVAARPGMGKSALAVMMATEAARQNVKVLIASLEMSAAQLTHRMISTHARIDGHCIQTGYISDDHWRKIGDSCAKLSEYGIVMTDDAALTLNQLRIHCRRLGREKLGLVIVDYLQLLDAETRGDNRTREIDVIAKALKGIAKEHHVPVVALAQLSREVDKRNDHRPVMGDLRESGGIEANADVVIFPYNPAHYGLAEDRQDCEPVQLIVAKYRDGMVGTAKALWFRRFTEFANVAKNYDEPAPVAPLAPRADLDGLEYAGPIDPLKGWNP